LQHHLDRALDGADGDEGHEGSAAPRTVGGRQDASTSPLITSVGGGVAMVKRVSPGSTPERLGTARFPSELFHGRDRGYVGLHVCWFDVNGV
jgi:hypothetical protein